MPRRARIHYVSLHSSLVNLPISIYGPLLERSIRPQNLAVHLTLVSQQNGPEKVEAYVGWTGMASASSLAHFNSSGEKGLETVEIDPQYAQGLGLAQGDVVDIGLLHDLSTANSVGTEPLSPDDWEIIEINASHVESTLLSQVRVANIGQEIDVWVLGRTRIRLRVVSLDPSSKGTALLLTTNTEVSIAPKLRNATKKGSTSTITPEPKPKSKISPQVLRVLPPHVLPASFSPSPPPSSYIAPEILAYVSKQTYSLLSLLPIHNIKEPQHSKLFQAKLHRLKAPSHPSEPAPPTSSPPSTTSRVLHPGAAPTNDTPVAPTSDLWIGWAADIPNSHIVFPSMVEGVAEWALVRVSPTGDHESPANLFSKKVKSTTPYIHSPIQKSIALAGVDDILEKCKNFCLYKLMVHASQSSVRGVSALLVAGRSGAGKTSIVQSVAKSLQHDPKAYMYTHYVDLLRFTEQPVSTVKGMFNYWFNIAAWHRPTILILDNLEKLLSAEVEHADSFRSRHLTELFLATYSSAARSAPLDSRGIILLATAQSQAALHPLLNSAHIFDQVVNVKPPNKDARKEIISHIVQSRLEQAPDIRQDPDAPLNYAALSTQTEGYSATDLQDLVARAVHQAAIRASDSDQTILAYKDFEAAQVDFTPLSLRDVGLQKSDVAWSDIGGLQETRRVLRETLEWPTKYGPIFAQSPLRLRSGLLLYGYPGCGKTLLASAVAKECGLNFISVKGPEILNKYIGASEKSVRDLFERASAAKPCVLFFDEFDSIAPKRGHDSTGVTDRVVNQMLTQMDGAEGLDGVYVLAATSRPDLIDSALLRPGRLDKSLLCNMPNIEERRDILQAVSSKVTLSPDVDLDAVADATDGFSGADLQALVYNAHLEVVHASIASTSTEEQGSLREEDAPVEYTIFGGSGDETFASRAEEAALQKRLQTIRSSVKSRPATRLTRSYEAKKHEITTEDLKQALRTTRPSVSPEERQRLTRIYNAFTSDRSGGLPVPPDAGGVGNRVSLG